MNKLPNGWIETSLGDKEYFEILPSGINKFSGEKEYLSTESIKKTKIVSSLYFIFLIEYYLYKMLLAKLPFLGSPNLLFVA